MVCLWEKAEMILPTLASALVQVLAFAGPAAADDDELE